MKKNIKLAMLFASIAAGNMQAVVVKGHPQHQTGPVRDMIAIRPVERHMEKIGKDVSDIHTAKEDAVSATRAASIEAIVENFKRKFNPDELRYLSQRLLEGTVMRPVIAEEPHMHIWDHKVDGRCKICGSNPATYTPKYLPQPESGSKFRIGQDPRTWSPTPVRPPARAESDARAEESQSKQDESSTAEVQGLLGSIGNAGKAYVDGTKREPKSTARGFKKLVAEI